MDPAAAGAAGVALGPQIGSELVMEGILQEELERARGVRGEIAPERGRVVDLLPEVGYGEFGQELRATDHGVSSPFLMLELGSGYALSFGSPSKVHRVPYTTASHPQMS